MVAAYTNSWWPSDFDGATVQGTMVGLDGAPISNAKITFAATPKVLLDYAHLKKIIPRGLEATTDANGFFSIVLPATDDPDINPINFTYTVSEGWVGGSTYSIEAPKGVVTDLATVTPVPSADGIPMVRGPKGEAGSVTQVMGRNPDGLGRVDLSGLVLEPAHNLSDLTDLPLARTHLGLGSIATHAIAELNAKLAAAANLGDLTDPVAARNNLGLGSMAQQTIDALPKGKIGSAESDTDVPLSSALGIYVSCPADVKVVVPADADYDRWIKVDCSLLIACHTGTPSIFRIHPAIAVGTTNVTTSLVATVTTGVQYGVTGFVRGWVNNFNAPGGMFSDVFKLPRGQAAVAGFVLDRDAAGDPTDVLNYSSVVVTDLGAAVTP